MEGSQLCEAAENAASAFASESASAPPAPARSSGKVEFGKVRDALLRGDPCDEIWSLLSAVIEGFPSVDSQMRLTHYVFHDPLVLRWPPSRSIVRRLLKLIVIGCELKNQEIYDELAELHSTLLCASSPATLFTTAEPRRGGLADDLREPSVCRRFSRSDDNNEEDENNSNGEQTQTQQQQLRLSSSLLSPQNPRFVDICDDHEDGLRRGTEDQHPWLRWARGEAGPPERISFRTFCFQNVDLLENNMKEKFKLRQVEKSSSSRDKMCSLCKDIGDDAEAHVNDYWGLTVLQNPSVNALGMRLWGASVAMVNLILSHPEMFEGRFILELGSGVGLVSSCLGKLNCHILATDYLPSVLLNLQENMKHNQIQPQGGNVGTQILDWSHFDAEQVLRQHLDPPHYSRFMVVATDCVYDEELNVHLSNALEKIMDCAASKFGANVVEAIFYVLVRDERTFQHFCQTLKNKFQRLEIEVTDFVEPVLEGHDDEFVCLKIFPEKK